MKKPSTEKQAIDEIMRDIAERCEHSQDLEKMRKEVLALCAKYWKRK